MFLPSHQIIPLFLNYFSISGLFSYQSLFNIAKATTSYSYPRKLDSLPSYKVYTANWHNLAFLNPHPNFV